MDKETIDLSIRWTNLDGETNRIRIPIEKFVTIDAGDKDILNIEKLNNSNNYRMCISKSLYGIAENLSEVENALDVLVSEAQEMGLYMPTEPKL